MTDKRLISYSADFPKVLKVLRKKYRNIQADVKDFVAQLSEGDLPGDRLQGTKNFIVYKARVASRDMQRGKSGGFRIIYYLQLETRIILLTMPNLSSLIFLLKRFLNFLKKSQMMRQMKITNQH